MRVLSGIQPTGRPHWGNYFGAIRQYIDLQGNEVGSKAEEALKAHFGTRILFKGWSTHYVGGSLF